MSSFEFSGSYIGISGDFDVSTSAAEVNDSQSPPLFVEETPNDLNEASSADPISEFTYLDLSDLESMSGQRYHWYHEEKMKAGFVYHPLLGWDTLAWLEKFKRSFPRYNSPETIIPPASRAPQCPCENHTYQFPPRKSQTTNPQTVPHWCKCVQ